MDIPIEHIARFQVSELTAGERLIETLNTFWQDFRTEPSFTSLDSAKAWLFDHLAEYRPFRELMKLCRGTAISFHELASGLFPDSVPEKSLPYVGVLLAMVALAQKEGNVLFPCPRAHALSRHTGAVCLLQSRVFPFPRERRTRFWEKSFLLAVMPPARIAAAWFMSCTMTAAAEP